MALSTPRVLKLREVALRRRLSGSQYLMLTAVPQGYNEHPAPEHLIEHIMLTVTLRTV